MAQAVVPMHDMACACADCGELRLEGLVHPNLSLHKSTRASFEGEFVSAILQCSRALPANSSELAY